jgi:hypothetical protein
MALPARAAPYVLRRFAKRSTWSGDFEVVAQRGHQPTAPKRAQGPLLGYIENHRILGLPAADECHDAVIAGVRPLHDAPVTFDGQRRHVMKVVTWQ